MHYITNIKPKRPPNIIPDQGLDVMGQLTPPLLAQLPRYPINNPIPAPIITPMIFLKTILILRIMLPVRFYMFALAAHRLI